ncbi:hypothetical protein fugu_001501 [Takifugu bimaculatus]|uniref:Mitochondrial import inner membrane translocase subunit TIM50 n=1 Tax=Takifugu bimaculatus TaxID=433685 RepID=A0A4Z2CJT8_9TELE|nr:hypothetical protein fugu_001501 [Takifugu bimaculatus]
MKTPVDIVIEDYFDLFDRGEYYGHTFLQKTQYISCFDGGDIDARLHLQSQVHKQTEYECKEISAKTEQYTVQDSDPSCDVLEGAAEEEGLRDDTSSGSMTDPDECMQEWGSSLADDETECDEAEEDRTCEFYDQVSDKELTNSEEEDTHEATEQTGDTEEEEFDDETSEFCECEYCIPPDEQVPVKPLLPPTESHDAKKICVVIDLDETLVHSSFTPVSDADFIIPVEIEGTVHQVYVLKRPHVDEFLKRMGELFECVLFTASLSKYADPVSDMLDTWGAFRNRLFRESVCFPQGELCERPEPFRTRPGQGHYY